jgi:hypothetical protein
MRRLILATIFVATNMVAFSQELEEHQYIRHQKEQFQQNILISAAIAIGLWLALRPVVLWYYKINHRTKVQEQQLLLLVDIRRLLKKQAAEGPTSHEVDCDKEIQNKITQVISELAIKEDEK